MSTTGLGLASAGLSPAGLGTPESNTRLVSPGYEQSAGGCVSSVNIEYGTRDFTYDDYGNEEPMSDTAQRVYLLCRTTLGSRVNFRTTGMQTPTHIVTSRIQREVERYVRTALKPVTDDGSVTLNGVEVTTSGNMVLAVIRWTDNRQQREETTRIPLAQ